MPFISIQPITSVRTLLLSENIFENATNPQPRVHTKTIRKLFLMAACSSRNSHVSDQGYCHQCITGFEASPSGPLKTIGKVANNRSSRFTSVSGHLSGTKKLKLESCAA